MGFLTAWAAPAAFYLGLSVAGVVGLGVATGGTIAAWKYQGTKITKLEGEKVALETAVRIAGEQAEKVRADAQFKVEQLTLKHDREQTERDESYEQSIKALREAASPTRMCLSGPVVGLLNDGPGRRPARKNKDPREALGLTPGPAADPNGPAGPGVSERAVADYLGLVKNQYMGVKNQVRTLAGLVRECPQYEVVEEE
jgi:hypothetical protein